MTKQDFYNMMTVSSVLGQLGGLQLLLKKCPSLPDEQLTKDLHILKENLDQFVDHVHSYINSKIEIIIKTMDKTEDN